ncbi:MAG: imidazolonepropionase, partial [Bacillota bacterium]|nr:imidazolonepropionase [Bacillota bacterium]
MGQQQSVDLLIKNAKQLVTSVGASAKPLIKEELSQVLVIEEGAVAIKDGLIAAVGTTDQVMEQITVNCHSEVIDASNQVVLPGLVDPHTHLIFAGSREHEMELKLAGKSYLEILAQGGGILSTVRATRQASLEELTAIGEKYAQQMLAQGTTTAEVKSGYGLDTATEIKQLQAVQALTKMVPLELVPTFLGAHAIPPEYKQNPEQFVDLVIDEMLPQVAQEGLAKFCDVFCEEGVFTVDQSRRILEAAKRYGLQPKLHADEIKPL